MTNFPDDPIADGDPVTTQLNADLTDLFAATVPDLKFERPAMAPSRAERRISFRLAGLAAGIVAVAVAAAVITPGLFGGGTQAVDAAEILARASAVTENHTLADGASYHLVAEIRAAGDVSTSETWYGADDRYRTEQRSSAGSEPSFVIGQVVNGADTWLYLGVDDAVNAVHGDSSALGLAGVNLLGMSLSDQSSLADILDEYTTGSCQSAEQQGAEAIAGRSAYVIVVTPDPANCPEGEMRLKTESLTGSSVTLWVDQETFVTLGIEQTDVDGVAAFTYAVTEVQVGADLPESTFTYEAPVGVTIQETTDISDAKDKLSGF
ncbi:MAG: hypothetical protein WD904_04995 [Dehalococcoidia bacterium]